MDEVESGQASATETDVLAALELAENGRRLNARDFMALVSPAASPYLETMARIARDVTVRQFGRSIQLFTPLYLANYCTNQCVYCGFNTKNHIHRSMLTMDEVEAEGKVIAATGLRNILLLTGDAPKLTGPAYIAEAARRLRPYFPSIGVTIGCWWTREWIRSRCFRRRITRSCTSSCIPPVPNAISGSV